MVTVEVYYDVWKAPGAFENLLTNQMMPIRAPADV